MVVGNSGQSHICVFFRTSQLKEIVHPQMNCVIIYSPWCLSKPVWLLSSVEH